MAGGFTQGAPAPWEVQQNGNDSASAVVDLSGYSPTGHSHAEADVTNLPTDLALLAPIASPTFTGTVSGITKSMVGLGSVDNTSDAGKPVSTAQQTALDLKANLASPTFTGTVSGITKSMVGLGSVDNTSDAGKPVSTAQQTALDLKANLASPTFTGTVSGITAAMVGAQPLDSDLTTLAGLTATTDNMIVSVASAWASRTPAQVKTTLALVKGDVGLGSVDNTADPAKNVLSATKWTTARTVAITGDLAYTSPSLDGTGNVTAAGTLATVNSNVGSFGTASKVAAVTVNAKGLVTAASETTIAIPESAVTNLVSDLATHSSQISTLSNGTISGNGTMTGPVFQTSVPGAGHPTIMIDGPNNIMKFYAGLASETAGYIDLALNGGRPQIEVQSATTATYPSAGRIDITSGATGSGSVGLSADTVSLTAVTTGVTITAGFTTIATGGLTVSAPGTLAATMAAGSVGTGTFRDSVDARADARIQTLSVVKCAVTTNLTLSGTQTIDGVSAGVGDLVGAFGQTTTANSGPYIVASGAWTRATWADTAAKMGSLGVVQVQSGTLNGSTRWVTPFKTTDTLGTTACPWYPSDAVPHAGGWYSTATDQTVATATFTTVAIGGTTDHDYLGTTIATNIVTVNSAGTYDIRASILWDTSASNTLRQFIIETYTGADPGVGLGTPLVYDIRPTGTNGNVGQSISVTYTFAAGAKVRAIVYQASGGNLKVMHSLSRSRFAIRKIA